MEDSDRYGVDSCRRRVFFIVGRKLLAHPRVVFPSHFSRSLLPPAASNIWPTEGRVLIGRSLVGGVAFGVKEDLVDAIREYL